MDYSFENIQMVMSIWMFVCALIGSIYGILNLILKKKALYLKMIACGIGCRMFAMLFVIVFILAQGQLRMGFNVGVLGIIGSLMFFFTANYGQMDSLVDDGSKTFLPTRIKALLAPLIMAFLYIGFCFKVTDTELRVVLGVVTLFVMGCSYYNFKHVIIFDVECGIIRCVKSYNILACGYELLIMLELISYYMELRIVYVISCVLIGLISVIILPVLQKGAKRWITQV